MLTKIHSSAQVESLMKVTPNWSHSNKMALSIGEALLHSQWQAFQNHVSNNLPTGEQNVFNEDERTKCQEALQLWKEKTTDYVKLTKESFVAGTQ